MAFRRCSRTVWRSASSALLALSLVACGTSAVTSPGSASPSASAGPHAVAFTDVAATSNSRQDGGATLIVGTTDQRTELIRSLIPTTTPPASGTILLAAFQGQQRTGGYGIKITSISRDGDALIVRATFTQPPAGGVVTEVITSPAHVVAIASSDVGGAKTAVLLDATGVERARIALT